MKHPEMPPACPDPENCEEQGLAAENHPNHDHAKSWDQAIQAADEASRNDPQSKRVYNYSGDVIHFIKHDTRNDRYKIRYPGGVYFPPVPEAVLVPHVE